MSEQLVVVDEQPYVANIQSFVTSILRSPVQPSPDRYKFDRVVLHRTYLSPTVKLFNIPFVVRKEGGHVHLDSVRWPTISAFGDDFQEAVVNLNALLKDLVAEYVLVPEELLADDAIELRNYLISRIF